MTTITDRELDALVAEHVMEIAKPYVFDYQLDLGNYVPTYLSNVSDVLDVIEKVGGSLECTHYVCGPSIWTAVLEAPNSTHTQEGPTWQSAWRRCVIEYLRAKGVTVDD